MSVGPGLRLGVYEVRGLIGVGGMGEVYRGHDSRLKRDVALKILPDLFALDPDRLGRFKREAQVLASLNHANIASIFGFEEWDGVHALVMELVEGPTLADCIARGPMAPEDALPIARQIAQGLEAAHAEGIVHRDLKPANVKVRNNGTVKVLDFGLAKALSSVPAAPPGAGQSLTITSPALTQLGMILGTAVYMSPEQARGRIVDKRSDIWAFGCVLYEMLTGRRAFDGEDVSDTLANVLKREPDWSALPAHTPANIQRTLRRCLEKDPARRFHDIADVRLELEDHESAASAVTHQPAPRRLTIERAAWGLVVALLGGGFAYSLTREAPGLPVVRFQIHSPQDGSFGASTGVGRADGTSGATLSPDGSQITFIVELAGRTQLWLRPLAHFGARALAGTDGAMGPFWSPDGREIGFFAGTN